MKINKEGWLVGSRVYIPYIDDDDDLKMDKGLVKIIIIMKKIFEPNIIIDR